MMSQGLTTTDSTPSIPAADSTKLSDENGDDNASSGDYSFNDPDFVQNMLRGLPGVDPDDERIKAALSQIYGNKGDEKDKKKDGDKN